MFPSHLFAHKAAEVYSYLWLFFGYSYWAPALLYNVAPLPPSPAVVYENDH